MEEVACAGGGGLVQCYAYGHLVEPSLADTRRVGVGLAGRNRNGFAFFSILCLGSYRGPGVEDLLVLLLGGEKYTLSEY